MTNELHFEISDHTPFAEGHEFGTVGAYERLRGWVHYAVDPKAPAQADIVDIDKAPVNAKGLVEFAAEVFILRPAAPDRGNKRIFYDYGNRGSLRAVQYFNEAPHSNDPNALRDAGNGYFFHRGYTLVWSAWQGDLLPGDKRVVMELPIATENGKPITGTVRQEFIAAEPQLCFPLSGRPGTRSHPATSLDTSRATLTRRRYPASERITIPSSEWRFALSLSGTGVSGETATRGATENAIIPSDQFIYLDDGFQPGWIYELIYEAHSPLVMGLGHIAVRDLISFCKYQNVDARGAPSPVGPIEKAYGWGRSQTGRCLRDFLYRGFNADADGRKVFDGAMPHVAGAGRMWLNHRFANAVSMAGQQYEDHHILADEFPFAYAQCTDHLTGKTDAILQRPDTDPHVMHTQSASEYWQRRGSLAHTDTQGNDLDQPDNVRVYLWSSSQHQASPTDATPVRGVCQNLNNNVNTAMFFRALLDAMDEWVTNAAPPPDSRIPRRKDGTIATYDEWLAQFPTIPGQMVTTGPAGLPLLDHGPDSDRGILAKHPPDIVNEQGYTVLIPAVDSDGNDVAGIRAPMVQAPLGTYTGWNTRGQGYGTGANYEFSGSYIPFMDSTEEREFIKDPRPAIVERYATPNDYLNAIEAAARQLVADRLMLEEDIARTLDCAADWGRPRHVTKL
ncbi:MAG: hypothetical protein ACI9DC_005289 [Gammaproteobacteria bacterium]